MHAAEHRGDEQHERDEVQEVGALFALGGDVVVGDVERRDEPRRDAAGDEPEGADLSAVRLQEMLRALHLVVRAVAGAVVDHVDLGRLSGAKVLRVLGRDDQADVVVARLHPRLEVRRGRVHHRAVPGEKIQQSGRVLAAAHRDVERLRAGEPRGHQGEEDPDEQRIEERHHQRRGERAAIAQVIARLLAEDRQNFAPEGRLHASSPWSEPMILTKASSRLSWPASARSSSGVPSATTRPLAMTTM